MKRLILYISTFVAAGALMASCDVNKPDIFDDANAFVAFDKATIAVDEDYSADGAVLKVPVTLASVAGIEENVSFRVVEGTAKAGVNYELLTTSGVLSFNAENRTQYIEFEILQDGKFTGDISFTIGFVNTNSVKQGAENTCVVTIGDIDHPLAAMFGTYTFSGKDEEGTPVTWSVQIYKDDADVNRVWLLNLPNPVNGFETAGIDFYGTVDDDMTTITIPFGQITPSFNYNGQDVILYGVTPPENIEQAGTIEGTIIKEGDRVTGIKFSEGVGLACYIDQAGFCGVVMPDISATKN